MPSIIINNEIKKKFEGIRGKFLSTGLFTNLTREEALELMVDVINETENSHDECTVIFHPFGRILIKQILEKRKENAKIK